MPSRDLVGADDLRPVAGREHVELGQRLLAGQLPCLNFWLKRSSQNIIYTIVRFLEVIWYLCWIFEERHGVFRLAPTS